MLGSFLSVLATLLHVRLIVYPWLLLQYADWILVSFIHPHVSLYPVAFHFWLFDQSWSFFFYWQLLVAFGNYWQPLATFGNYRQPLAIIGNYGQVLTILGSFWQLWAILATFGNYRQPWSIFGNFW